MDEGSGNNPEILTGATFGKYRITRKLGSGAFGSVYEALVPGPMGFAKKIAIKKIHSSLVDEDPKFVQSMVNEARIGGLLHHANIVDTIEFGEVGGHYYMAMEYVDGATLAEVIDLCRRRGVLLPRFAIVDLAIQVCRGLHYAHNLRDHAGNPVHLIHRDLKPSNVMVDREGAAMICDFGIAKAASNLYHTTSTGMVKGTPRYMSPEQITGEGTLSAASDIFSLGAVLYELITGRVLFHAKDFSGLIYKIVTVQIDKDLDAAERAFPECRPLLQRALQADPMDRYPDARALADELRALGRAYPAEADMADVVGKLLPAVDRSNIVEIQDSAALDLEASAVTEREGEVDPSAYDAPSGQTPVPAAATSAGWQRFTAAFDTQGLKEALADYDPDQPTQAITGMPRVSTPSESSAITEPDGDAATVQIAPVTPPGAPTMPMAPIQPVQDLDPPRPAFVEESPPPRSARGLGRLIAVLGIVALFGVAALGIALVITFGSRGGDPAEPAAEDTPSILAEVAVPVSDPTEEAPTEAASEAPEEAITAEPVTEPPVTVEPATPAPPEPVTAAPPPPPPEEEPEPAAPGTVSLYTKPWSVIWIDGAHVARSNRLKAHELSAGTHSISISCPNLDNREHVFTVTIDGNHVDLGCWDFETMAACVE